MMRGANQFAFSNWAPAFAGVVVKSEAFGGAHG